MKLGVSVDRHRDWHLRGRFRRRFGIGLCTELHPGCAPRPAGGDLHRSVRGCAGGQSIRARSSFSDARRQCRDCDGGDSHPRGGLLGSASSGFALARRDLDVLGHPGRSGRDTRANDPLPAPARLLHLHLVLDTDRGGQRNCAEDSVTPRDTRGLRRAGKTRSVSDARSRDRTAGGNRFCIELERLP